MILAYRLTRDSFVGFNLVTIALFIGKGFVLYLIMRRLTRGNKMYAILVGLLFVVFPADAGLFTFRAINITHRSSGVPAGGVIVTQIRPIPALVVVTAPWIAAVYALLTYEITYPLVFVTPLLLVLQEGRLVSERIFA